MDDPLLHALDQWLFFGHEPATVLHSVLGETWAAHVLRVRLPALPAAGAAQPRRLAGLVAQHQLRLLVRHRQLPDLDAGHDQLLRDPDAWARLLVPLALHGPRRHRRHRPAGLAVERPPGRPVPAQPVQRLDPERGRLRVAARRAHARHRAGRALHGAARRASAGRPGSSSGSPSISTLYFGWHYVADDIAGAVIAVARCGWALAHRAAVRLVRRGSWRGRGDGTRARGGAAGGRARSGADRDSAADHRLTGASTADPPVPGAGERQDSARTLASAWDRCCMVTVNGGPGGSPASTEGRSSDRPSARSSSIPLTLSSFLLIAGAASASQ